MSYLKITIALFCASIACGCDSTWPRESISLLETLKQDSLRAEAKSKAGDPDGVRQECRTLKEDWRKLEGLKDGAILKFKSLGFEIPNEEDIQTRSEKIETEIGAFCGALNTAKVADAAPLKNELAEAQELAQRYTPLCTASESESVAVLQPQQSARRDPASR